MGGERGRERHWPRYEAWPESLCKTVCAALFSLSLALHSFLVIAPGVVRFFRGGERARATVRSRFFRAAGKICLSGLVGSLRCGFMRCEILSVLFFCFKEFTGVWNYCASGTEW